METMTIVEVTKEEGEIIAQLRRDGNYDYSWMHKDQLLDHSTTKTGWKL